MGPAVRAAQEGKRQAELGVPEGESKQKEREGEARKKESRETSGDAKRRERVMATERQGEAEGWGQGWRDTFSLRQKRATLWLKSTYTLSAAR